MTPERFADLIRSVPNKQLQEDLRVALVLMAYVSPLPVAAEEQFRDDLRKALSGRYNIAHYGQQKDKCENCGYPWHGDGPLNPCPNPSVKNHDD